MASPAEPPYLKPHRDARIEMGNYNNPDAHTSTSQHERCPQKEQGCSGYCGRHWKTMVMMILIIFFLGVVMLVIQPYLLTSGIVRNTSSEPGGDISLGLMMPMLPNANQLSMKQSLHKYKDLFSEKTFPNIDYSLLGYNILRGYPMAPGHDPGFTKPIFKADYTANGLSADQDYKIPAGLYVIRDISCVISFSSEEIMFRKQFTDSLSTSASAELGSYGVSFSASLDYKSVSSEISTGKTVFVVSKASCDSYYTSLNAIHLPPFDTAFLEWAKQLVTDVEDDEDLFRFVEYYGTHYATDIKFGARYVYRYKMTSDQHEKLEQEEIAGGVSAQASYLGLFSVGGGFKMSEGQISAAEQFSKSVETTTITVGAAPPKEGGVMAWASSVKYSPVPTQYHLETIDKLFTAEHMGHLSFNYEMVRKRLYSYIMNETYCNALLKKGIVDTCEDLSQDWVTFRGVYVSQHITSESLTETKCVRQCIRDENCTAVMTEKIADGNCFFLKSNVEFTSTNNRYKVMVFPLKIRSIQTPFTIQGAWLQAIEERDGSAKVKNVGLCRELCYNDTVCYMYNYCDSSISWCSSLIENCRLYSIHALKKLEVPGALQWKEGAVLEFISRREAQA